MSHLVRDRRDRINYMLHETEESTKSNITYFEEIQHNPNPKQLFDTAIWTDIEAFLAKMAKYTGLRDRVLKEYFDILKNCGDLEIDRKNSHRFRNRAVTERYLVEHPELA
jgi:adenine C2-methylase RlmN of 23S rRNA A2503 and tRNA A37